MESRLVALNDEELNNVEGGSITLGTAIVICACVVLVGSAAASFFNGLTDGLKE